MSIWTKAFWKDAAERVVATAAQVAVAMLSADGMGVLDVAWTQTGSVVALAALLAFFKALAASRVGSSYEPTHASK